MQCCRVSIKETSSTWNRSTMPEVQLEDENDGIQRC